MKWLCGFCLLCFSLGASVAFAQVPQVEPRVLTKTELEGKVTVVEVAARFVTAIRLPDAVNSVVVGDPTEFQVEHSDREPKLVFVKAVSKKPSETNLLISTAAGHQVSLLLVNRGDSSPDLGTIDFLVKYEAPNGFFVGPSGFPFALVGATAPLTQSAGIATDGTQAISKVAARASTVSAVMGSSVPAFPDVSRSDAPISNLDKLLEQQESAPLPVLYGEHIGEESTSGDRVRAGVSRVIDGGEQVIVLFSVVNPTKHAILLMPPQVQLGGRTTSGKGRKKWSTAEQLPIEDFRLNRRRLGLGDRADGVVVFVRPPYKQSSETLLLQVAESGAVDRPALAPIGFGVSSSWEEQNGRGK
ncbi:MAG TPA: hypothetical protein VN777_14140 [Terriglobales bacterium]|nr:hypothetical protein [Terriglobales bacterium]